MCAYQRPCLLEVTGPEVSFPAELVPELGQLAVLPARQSSGPPHVPPAPGPPLCKHGGYVPPQKQAEQGTRPGDTWWP